MWCYSIYELMKFIKFDPGIEWEGILQFMGFAEGDWIDDWRLQYSWGSEDSFDSSSLVPNEIYLVSFTLGRDDAGYNRFRFINARNATMEEINQLNMNW